jgi:hypothetical protein
MLAAGRRRHSFPTNAVTDWLSVEVREGAVLGCGTEQRKKVDNNKVVFCS